MLHPECHHNYLRRRIDRLYAIVDGGQSLHPERREAMMTEIRQIRLQLNRIEPND